MKNGILIFAYLLIFNNSSGQQWISKKYAYDSLLNITYGTAVNFNGGIDTLQMDIYTPYCDDSAHVSRMPLLIWIHGGAFLAGDKGETSITNLCKQFARRGYVTASINYRLGFVADDVAWNCNFPNYNCMFATDSAEWYRSYYRSIQDAKGALRYLINRHSIFRIDTNQVFVAGESAGAFVALGICLLDTLTEKPVQTGNIAPAQIPHINSLNCQYNTGKTFSGVTISRPDLGSIDGDIEPTTINFSIKGIGNMYGGMLSDLLANYPLNKPKPAIYSFHQPCDLIVPIDSGNVFAGLSWCMTNGYGCYGVGNTPKVYGSRTFSDLNTLNNYGYTIHNEFTLTNFPYSFLIGTGSCTDQASNPCHAYDNAQLREDNLASFFAPLITINPVCDTGFFVSAVGNTANINHEINIYPIPSGKFLTIENTGFKESSYRLYTIHGQEVFHVSGIQNQTTTIDLSNNSPGIYFLHIHHNTGLPIIRKIIKGNQVE